MTTSDGSPVSKPELPPASPSLEPVPNERGGIGEKEEEEQEEKNKEKDEKAGKEEKKDKAGKEEKKELFDEARDIRSPREILRTCLSRSLADIPDAKKLCYDRCEETYKELKEGAGFQEIVIKIVEHFEARGATKELWQWIKDNRIGHYGSWFPQWEKAVDKLRAFDETDYTKARLIGHTVRRVGTRGSDTASGQTETIGEHALASARHDTIRDWFFSELDPSERGVVLATALFEGINRHYLAELSDSVEKICFGTSKPKEGVG